MGIADSLYTRSELGKLASVDDATMNYWSREGLLIPSEGGAGRGSHRKFDFVQVNIAALLGQLRRFGLSISVMRSFAHLLQDAARIVDCGRLHPANYTDAAHLADKLHSFRAGEPVLVPARDASAERPSGMSRKAFTEWLLADRPAVDEHEVVEYLLRSIDYDSKSAVLEAAEKLGPGRKVAAEIYSQLVLGVLAPGYSDAYSMLLGFDESGNCRIEFGFEGAKFFGRVSDSSTDAEDFGPGIFLPTSGIIRRVWGLKTPREHNKLREASYLERKLAERGIAAKVFANPEPEQGFRIDAPDVEPDVLDAALSELGYEDEPRSNVEEQF